MINLDTIISAFNDKLTLLQWLKNVNKALEDGILTSVDVERVNVDKVKINFTFADGTKQTTNTFDLKTFEGLTELERLIKGSESVIVDVNEEGNALEVHLDAEVLQRIYKTLVLPASAPTSEELVGIDETGAQSRVTIGEGLTIENGALKVSGGLKLYKHSLYADTGIVFVTITSFDATPLTASNINSKKQYFTNVLYQGEGVITINMYNGKVYLLSAPNFLGSYSTDLHSANFTFLRDEVTEL